MVFAGWGRRSLRRKLAVAVLPVSSVSPSCDLRLGGADEVSLTCSVSSELPFLRLVMVCTTFAVRRLVGLVVVSAGLRLGDVFCSLEVDHVDVLVTICRVPPESPWFHLACEQVLLIIISWCWLQVGYVGAVSAG